MHKPGKYTQVATRHPSETAREMTMNVNNDE